MNNASKRPRLSHEGFECPVCLEVPRGCNKIFICINGHDVCGICMTKINDTCPNCRGGYNNPPTRNLSLERIIEDHLEFTCENEGCEFKGKGEVLRGHEENDCKHRMVSCLLAPGCIDMVKAMDLRRHMEDGHKECKHGCQFVGQQDKMAEHEMKCLLRKIPCPHLSCNQHVHFVNLTYHMTQDHRMTHRNGSSGNFRTKLLMGDRTMLAQDQEKLTLDFFVFDSKTFIASCLRSPEGDGTFYVWMKMVGDKEGADRYSVSIRAYGNDMDIRKTCKVHAVDVEDSCIMADLDCFTISLINVKQCLETVHTNEVTEEQKAKGCRSKLQVDFLLKKK